MRRFTKVNYKTKSSGGVEVTAEWNEPLDNGESEQHQLKCNMLPLESFTTRMQGLASHLARIIEVHENYADTIVVTDISVAREGSEITSAVISGKKTLSNGQVIALNTPNTQEGLNEKCVEAIQAVFTEAERYVDGQRQQGELFAEEEEDEEEPEPAEA